MPPAPSRGAVKAESKVCTWQLQHCRGRRRNRQQLTQNKPKHTHTLLLHTHLKWLCTHSLPYKTHHCCGGAATTSSAWIRVSLPHESPHGVGV
jgi:hypothetical protein